MADGNELPIIYRTVVVGVLWNEAGEVLLCKLTPDGDLIPMYIIFLVFNCQTQASTIHLNEEFSKYKWVKPEEVTSLDLNKVTHDTLIKAERLYRQTRGYLPSVGSEKHNFSRE
jgi:hypothetical protein